MTTTALDVRRSITVMHSMARPKSGEPTRYANHMLDGAPSVVVTEFFSWKDALRADYDVFHMHWPEYLLRGRTMKARIGKSAAFALLLIKLRMRRIPVVRTAHNLQSHEAGGVLERTLVGWSYRLTTTVIRLNPTTNVPRSKPAVTILHGHYRDRFAEYDLPPSKTGQLLYFGLIRPYKGVVNLEKVFADLPRGDERLRIVGKPSHPDLQQAVLSAAAADDRISTWLEFVPDADLVREIGEAELVVLPYEEMHNSGSILVALSVGRPVLVPRSPANEALHDEVGGEWVIMYDGDLTSSVLTEALAAVSDGFGMSLPPNLAERDWQTVGERHYETYLQAIERQHRKA